VVLAFDESRSTGWVEEARGSLIDVPAFEIPAFTSADSRRLQPMAVAAAFGIAILVLGLALGAFQTGSILAGILLVGSTLAVVEDRRLTPATAAALGSLHVFALVVFTL